MFETFTYTFIYFIYYVEKFTLVKIVMTSQSLKGLKCSSMKLRLYFVQLLKQSSFDDEEMNYKE